MELEEKQLVSALLYANAGWPVFACKENKSPHWSRSTQPSGHRSATTDRAKVEYLFGKRFPGANIGVPAGRESGFWVMDVDDVAEYEGMVADLGKIPLTRTVGTPRGGLHLYFEYDERVTNSKGGLPSGIDVRGQGGYVIVPPGRTAAGTYDVLIDEPIVAAPEWLMEQYLIP